MSGAVLLGGSARFCDLNLIIRTIIIVVRVILYFDSFIHRLLNGWIREKFCDLNNTGLTQSISTETVPYN
jgi:hypothetical protein